MTSTTEGLIPSYTYLGFDCIVKLQTYDRGNGPCILMASSGGVKLPTPLRSPAGTLIYALPGGGQVDSGKR